MRDYRGNSGVMSGLLGCAFAILGIFTWGFLFVPIAALCSLVSLLSGLTAFSISGIAISFLSTFLTLVGLVTSPVLMLFLGISWLSSAPETPSASNASAPAIEQHQADTREASLQTEENIPCPVSGNPAVLTGFAYQQAAGDKPVFILKTDTPFCLTLTPPVAPRQRAVLSSVQIDGQPPPLGVRIELTGKLYASPLMPGGFELPALSVASGRRLGASK